MTTYKSRNRSEEEIKSNISKSQKKRDLIELRYIVEDLIHNTNRDFRSLGVEAISSAVLLARGTTNTTVMKRQIQYITKLIYKSEPEVLNRFMDLIDQQNVKKNNQKILLWRRDLLNNDNETFSLIITDHPSIDRQHLRQLIRNASIEKKRGQNGSACKKLFRFLIELDAY